MNPLILVFFMALISCGEQDKTDDSSDKESPPTTTSVYVPSNGVKVNIGDQFMILEKEIRLDSSCNEYLWDFYSSEEDDSCSSINVTANYIDDNQWTWSVIAPNKLVNFEASVDSTQETLTIGDATYYCYVYNGLSYHADVINGDVVYGLQVLLKNPYDSIDDVSDGDVFAVAGDEDTCTMLKQ